MSAVLEVVLAYASRGWHVIPLYEPDGEGRCSCGRAACASPGKHPRITRWQHRATTDAEQIREWWRRWPSANVGIATGPSGLLVVDVDQSKGGEVSLSKLEARFAALPATLRVRTGGGWHVYFTAPLGVEVRNSNGKLGPGIDVRAAGGYVVAPPSLHASGKRYEWIA